MGAGLSSQRKGVRERKPLPGTAVDAAEEGWCSSVSGGWSASLYGEYRGRSRSGAGAGAGTREELEAASQRGALQAVVFSGPERAAAGLVKRPGRPCAGGPSVSLLREPVRA